MGQDSMAETVTRSSDPVGVSAAPAAELCVVYPATLRATIPLGREPVVLGRHPDEPGGVRLAHPTVSRSHFAVGWDAGRSGFVGRDLGSRNGSRVGGRAETGAGTLLGDGEVVRLGDVLLVVDSNVGVGVDDPPGVSSEAIPGRAAATRRLRATVARAAPDPSPVLLAGETGTGKELVAREIHRLSGRKGPLLAINCAALAPALIDSQLFGHARGAFTGAQAAHPGMFRAAEKGSLLLDEIGELPLELQAKLLRVLQEREVLGLGETRPVRVDVRVLAATLRDLPTLARRGAFRLDLYARLGLWEIRVPALRERRADVLDWIDRLAARFHAERGVSDARPPRFDADAAERLLLHDWPDNLRGVDRLVHQLCSEGSGAVVGRPALDALLGRTPRAEPAAPGGGEADEQDGSRGAPGRTGERRLARLGKPSKAELEAVLAAHGGSVRAAAKHFGRERRQIYRWMEQLGVRVKES